MKEIKRKSKGNRYPLKIKLTNGKTLILPQQNKFDNEFLNDHGCSIMAEYIALQWVGIKKWPINLLKWHKKNTQGEIFSKVTIRGVAEGLEQIGGKNISVKYYRQVTEKRIANALSKGYLIIMEEKNPIHSVVLVQDNDGIFRLSHGGVSKTNALRAFNRATTNERYRGMIVVKDKRKKGGK